MNTFFENSHKLCVVAIFYKDYTLYIDSTFIKLHLVLMVKHENFYFVSNKNGLQGLFLADFIAVIRLYSQCQKVSFFPNFRRKIPNFKS